MGVLFYENWAQGPCFFHTPRTGPGKTPEPVERHGTPGQGTPLTLSPRRWPAATAADLGVDDEPVRPMPPHTTEVTGAEAPVPVGGERTGRKV